MIRYPVAKGDSLWKIARAYNITLDALLDANPQISDPNFILAGSVINIPDSWPDNCPAGSDFCPTLPACSADSGRPCIYPAAAGETLEDIAKKFMVPLTQMIYFNLRYGKKEALPAGSRIIIPEVKKRERELPRAYHQGRYPTR